jgi:hypothetical protein
LPRKNRSAGPPPTTQVVSKEITMTFRIVGLSPESFAPLFSMTDDQLAAHGAVRRVADQKPGYPCRVSLTDAEPGQPVILVHYEHQPAASPYRASHAIYVREGEVTYDAVDHVPDALRSRLLSVRGFDRLGFMVGADVVEGRALEGVIEQLFADSHTDYLHVHFAKPGCYAARVERA